MDTLNHHLRLADIAGKGDYEGKDYRDENGHWVLIYDAELWEKTGKKATNFPDFAHVEMSKDGWAPNQETLYRAREHWVTTTESFKVKTPIEENEKINRRQEEIYWETVNEFLEWHKEDFFTRLANAPDGKGFWESELEDWRNYKFSRSVIKGERHFWQVIPKWMDDQYPTKGQDRGNNQAKEEGRYRFFKWLEKLDLPKEVTPSSASTDANEKEKTALSTDVGKKRGGRTRDPEVQKRNFDICNDYKKYAAIDGLNNADALDRVYKSYKKAFTGKPKNIKDQIRRIIQATQSDTN